MEKLYVTHISSRGSSLRITLLKKIIDGIAPDLDDIITFLKNDGEDVIRILEFKE